MERNPPRLREPDKFCDKKINEAQAAVPARADLKRIVSKMIRFGCKNDTIFLY